MSHKLIEDGVRRALSNYFRDLGAIEPQGLHDLIIKAAERPLLVEELFLVMKAGGKGDIALADTSKLQFILPGPANSTRQVVEKAFAKAGLRLQVVAEVDGPWSTKSMVAAGLGATILSRSALYPEKAPTVLSVRRIVRPALTRAMNTCVRRGETLGRACATQADAGEGARAQRIGAGIFRRRAQIAAHRHRPVAVDERGRGGGRLGVRGGEREREGAKAGRQSDQAGGGLHGAPVRRFVRFAAIPIAAFGGFRQWRAGPAAFRRGDGRARMGHGPLRCKHGLG